MKSRVLIIRDGPSLHVEIQTALSEAAMIVDTAFSSSAISP